MTPDAELAVIVAQEQEQANGALLARWRQWPDVTADDQLRDDLMVLATALLRRDVAVLGGTS